MGNDTKNLPLQPNQVIEMATGDGFAKAIALRIGKSVKTIQKMWTDAKFCRYSRFLQLFIATYEENPDGGELIAEDFLARLANLRKKFWRAITDDDWFEQIAKCEEEHSQALQAAIRRRDKAAIFKEITEDINAKRKLLEMMVQDSTQNGFKSEGQEQQ